MAFVVDVEDLGWKNHLGVSGNEGAVDSKYISQKM